jgi:glycosyltransferase involved in cell wall biosynthesis
MKFEVTILMPCLNEAETLADCITAAQHGLLNAGVEGEILIADNGSTDGSRDIARQSGARVVDVLEKGYGNALQAGMEAAHGRFIIMGDSDLSYDFAEIKPFIEKLRNGADLVMGCRMPAGGGKIISGAMPWKHRWIGNPALTFMGRLLFRCPAHDFHCGLRALSKEAFYKMDLRTTGMEFASEMVIKAALRGLRIEEVPITLHKDGRSRPPHLRSWRDGWRHLRFMLLFSPRWLFLYPGAVFFVLGGILFLRLLLAPLQVGFIRFDINSLDLFGLMLQFGYQMILLACFVRIFSYTRGFLPENHMLSRLFEYFTLEKGLVVSLLLALTGIGIVSITLQEWISGGFGELNPLTNTRFVIAGRTFILLGLQTLLFSLVFSYLGLDEKKSQ